LSLTFVLIVVCVVCVPVLLYYQAMVFIKKNIILYLLSV